MVKFKKYLWIINSIFIFLVAFTLSLFVFSNTINTKDNELVSDKTKSIYAYVSQRYVDKIDANKVVHDLEEFLTKYEKITKQK